MCCFKNTFSFNPLNRGSYGKSLYRSFFAPPVVSVLTQAVLGWGCISSFIAVKGTFTYSVKKTKTKKSLPVPLLERMKMEGITPTVAVFNHLVKGYAEAMCTCAARGN